MYKVEGWIERVQTEFLFSREFPTLEEAREYLREDFCTRAYDEDFLLWGNYDLYESEWKRLPRPERVTKPTLDFGNV